MKPLSIADHQFKGTRYWLPAVFTTLTLWLGLVAVLFAAHHAVSSAAYAILAALVADNMDGRIARLTGSTSDFGKEYDSLSDMVAFGVAPAFTAAYATADTVGPVGWLGGLVYATCAGLRLARFNATLAPANDISCFIGLPSPVAASVIACGVLLILDQPQGEMTTYSGESLMTLTLIVGILMISPARFLSLKSVSMRRASRPLVALVVFASIAAFLGMFGWVVAAALFGYIVCSLCLLLRIPQE